MNIKSQKVSRDIRANMPDNGRHVITSVTNMSDDKVAVIIVNDRHMPTVMAAAQAAGYTADALVEMLYVTRQDA